MRLTILCLLFLMVHSTISADIYCSSLTGSDSNPGTLQLPVKTIKRAIEKSEKETFSKIFLKAGDTFYENVKLDKNRTLSSYGVGPKPIISGLRFLYNDWVRGEFANSKWKEKASGNIWRYCLTDKEGIECFNPGGSSILNNVGSLINPDTKTLYNCRRVKFPGDLNENFDFYQSVEPDKKNPISSLDYLYCCYNGDEPPMIAVPVGCIGVELTCASIENIRVEFFGHHGISPHSVSRVSNCEVFGIGGMLHYLNMEETGHHWSCLGNGIEVYVTKGTTVFNITVENCHVSDCFDCGLSLQGGSNTDTTLTTGAKTVNVVFQNNVVTRCLQGWESFLHNPLKYLFKYENCYVRHNLFVNNGTTPFRYYDDKTHNSSVDYLGPTEVIDGMIIPEDDPIRRIRNRCQMLSTADFYSGMIIEDNTFAGHNYLSAHKGSRIIIDPGGESPVKPVDPVNPYLDIDPGLKPPTYTGVGIYENQIYNRNLIIIFPGDYLLLNSTYHYPECMIPTLDLPDFTELLNESIARYRKYTVDKTSVIKIVGYDFIQSNFPYTLEQAEKLRKLYNLNQE